jgi:HEAT repeat protein
MSPEQPHDERLRKQMLQAGLDMLQNSTLAEDRVIAAGIVGSFGTEAVIPVLLELIQNEPNRQVQHKVSLAISHIGGEEAVNGLKMLIYTDNPYTRFLAAETLADIVAKGQH